MANQDATATVMMASQALASAAQTPSAPVYSDTSCTMMQSSSLQGTAAQGIIAGSMVFTFSGAIATMIIAGVPSLLADYVPGAVGAYSLRRVDRQYGGAAVNVRRSSDSTTQDIGFSGDNFDSASFSAFVGGGTGSVVVWYDQSGNGNDLGVSASLPTINLTGLGGLPTVAFVTGNNLSHATTPALTQPFTAVALAARTGTFTAFNGIVGDPTGAQGFYFNAGANAVALFAGSNVPIATCSDSVAHSLIALFNGAASAFTVDGSTTVAGSTPGTLGFAGLKIANFGSASGLTGNMSEVFAWPRVLTAKEITAIRNDHRRYYGTP